MDLVVFVCREWKDRPANSQCATPPGLGGPSPGHVPNWLAYDWPSKSFMGTLPADSLPVIFFSLAGLSFLTNPSPQGCCTAIGCAPLISSTMNVCEDCPPRERPSVTFCGDPQAVCYSSDLNEYELCLLENGEPYACQIILLMPCPTGPTPSPTPTPQCNPVGENDWDCQEISRWEAGCW
jgi:hypothetical protein